MDEKPKTPNLDKLMDNTATYNAIAQFLEWLTHDTHYHIAEYGDADPDEHGPVYTPYSRLWHTRKGPEELIYEFLELDPKVIDAERQSILDYLSGQWQGETISVPPEITMSVTIGDEREEI